MTITTCINKNKNITNDLYIADTFMKRLRGYMFRDEAHHEAIMLKPCNSIHTFFMRFNIDVLFLNDEMRVMKKVERLPPGKVIMPVKEACIVIEGREGLFENIKEGSKLCFDEGINQFD